MVHEAFTDICQAALFALRVPSVAVMDSNLAWQGSHMADSVAYTVVWRTSLDAWDQWQTVLKICGSFAKSLWHTSHGTMNHL